MNSDPNSWPELKWAEWSETAGTLHMLLQIVGKTRLALTPLQNHWWNVPLYLTARGLWTSPMFLQDGRSLDIEFDFISHELVFRTSSGQRDTLSLEPKTVKAFFAEYLHTLDVVGARLHIDPTPVEVAKPIRFTEDLEHHAYDRDAVSRFWQILRLADFKLKQFSTHFTGKISPVHFFWGAMDLAATRFNGHRATPRADGDAIQAEAYSHEVISAGFWPGNGGYGQAAFYAYAAPVPPGLSEMTISGPGAFDPGLGEFILNYSDVVDSNDPNALIQTFLEETYSAAAGAAHWDRNQLDRQDRAV